MQTTNSTTGAEVAIFDWAEFYNDVIVGFTEPRKPKLNQSVYSKAWREREKARIAAVDQRINAKP